ncbi:hypothetical protein [Saccharopolyspora sp. NPDC002376]
MTDRITTASYTKFVQAPTQWAAVNWSGQNITDIQGLFDAHGIAGQVMQAGTNTLLLIIGGASFTYAVGEQVVICNDGGTQWRHDPARRNLAGLVLMSDYYVTPPGA